MNRDLTVILELLGCFLHPIPIIGGGLLWLIIRQNRAGVEPAAQVGPIPPFWSIARLLGFVSLIWVVLLVARADGVLGSALLGTLGPAWLRTLKNLDSQQALGVTLRRAAIVAHLGTEVIRAGLILVMVAIPAGFWILIATARP